MLKNKSKYFRRKLKVIKRKRTTKKQVGIKKDAIIHPKETKENGGTRRSLILREIEGKDMRRPTHNLQRNGELDLDSVYAAKDSTNLSNPNF